MFTLIVQVWLVGTCTALLAVVVRDWKRERARAIEDGKRAAAQTQAACRARAAGAEAARVGTTMAQRGLAPAPAGRWTETEKNGLRGVPPRLDYLRTPAEMRAIRERIISEASASIAECRERRRIVEQN